MKQDIILLSWIFSSLTPTVLRKVNRLTSSHEVWSFLEFLFASKSDTHIHHLQCELRDFKKESLSMRDYIDLARDIIDNLAVDDTTITNTELRHCILAGLDSSYDAIVTSLTTSMGTMKLEDFITYLLTFELRVEQQNKTLNYQLVANIASSSRPTMSNLRSSTGQQPGGTRNKFPCQLCDKAGHPAHLCWKRFGRNFRPQPPRRSPVSPAQPANALRAYKPNSKYALIADFEPTCYSQA
ncbi:uncharacterized protein LOC113294302 [Papaver somniferum]|uniref:uncharacterized protein LOC113294302 n=1 Tax=Papaver somniferum TaxID=3469 RepID=UPI000E705683|nr:uncharacterized protein LOC113294302 [Papaver somniferum]